MNLNNTPEFDALREGIAGIDGDRVDLLLASAPYLSETLLPRCLALALDLLDVSQQDELMQVLARRIRSSSVECQRQSLLVLQSTDILVFKSCGADFLIEILPFLSQDLLPIAMQSVFTPEHQALQSSLLSLLSQRIYQEDLSSLTDLVLARMRQGLEAAVYENSSVWSANAWRLHEEETLLGLSAQLLPEQHEAAVWIARMLDPATKALVFLRFALDWGWDDHRQLEIEAFHSWNFRVEHVDGHGLRELVEELPEEARARWIDHLWEELFYYAAPQWNDYTDAELRRQLWPLFSPEKRSDWVSQKLEEAAQLPEKKKRRVEYFQQEAEDSPRADALGELAPHIPFEHLGRTLEIINTLPDPQSRLDVLQKFNPSSLYMGEALCAKLKLYEVPMVLLQPSVERACREIRQNMTGAASEERVQTWLEHARLTQGQLRDDLVGEAWKIVQQNAATLLTSPEDGNESERSYEASGEVNVLEGFYYLAPRDVLDEVVALVLTLPRDLQSRAVLEATKPLAQRWPEALLLLLQQADDEALESWGFERAWSFLPSEVKDALMPRIEKSIYIGIRALRLDLPFDPKSEEDEAFVRWPSPRLLPQSSRCEILRFVLGFPSSARRGSLLEELLETLPADAWQEAALAAWEDLHLADDVSGFVWDHPQFPSWPSLLRFLPEPQCFARAGELLQEIIEGTTRIAADGPDSASAEDAAEGEENEGSSEPPWAGALSALERLVLHLDEAGLRRSVSFLDDNQDLQIHREWLDLQGEVWPREQLLAQVLVALARTISVKEGFNHEVRVLLREALRLTFFYPHFPELGGNGGEDEELPSTLSPDQLLSGFNHCSPEEQEALLAEMLRTMSERSDKHESETAKAEELAQARFPSGKDEVRTRAELYLRGQFPSQVRLGQTQVLRVRVSPHHLKGDGVLQGVELSSQGAQLTLLLDAPDFEIRSKSRVEVAVSKSGDSDWAEFAVRPLQVGQVRLCVSVFQSGAYLGQLALRSEVVDKQGVEFQPEWTATLALAPMIEGAVTWCLKPDRRTGTIHHTLFAWNGGCWEAEEVPARATGQALEELIERIENQVDASSRRLLLGHGLDLWRECVPPAIQQALVDLLPQMRQLTILSEEDSRPWEMLHLNSSAKYGDQLLCEVLPVCRWKWGSPPPLQLSWQNPCFVITKPSESLGITEIGDIQRIMEAYREDVLPTFRAVEPLMAHLERSNFDWLHLTGHHDFDAAFPAASTFSLQDGRFQPTLLATLEERWKEQKPSVFLNACRTAGSTVLHSECDGWAQRCLRAGAGAFVGTQWEVQNHNARYFAIEFYERLSKQMPAGQAFFEARLSTRDQSQDCSWLAYALYANGQAQVAPTTTTSL